MIYGYLFFHVLSLVSGGTFGRSSREPKFKIEFHSEDSHFHPVSDNVTVDYINLYMNNFLLANDFNMISSQ